MKMLFSSILIGFINILNLSGQNTEFKINELMNAYAENGQFIGTILVQKGENIIYKNAFGLANREWNIPNTTDTKFLIGSIGKPFTALMTLILVNDGLIDLNAAINTYIPEYSGPGNNKATIHQMLTHTSGIPNHGAIPNLSKKLVRWNYNTDEYLELIRNIELKFEPGTGFEYSGIAYNLLAIICEKVTNKEFGELLKERILIPLDMNDTKHDKNLDIDTKRANGYEYHLLEGYMNPSYIEMCHVKGSGGILSTVEDMEKFSNECFKTQKLLPKELYKRMFTPYIKDWQYYGYGWWITKKNINGDSLTFISHGGSTDGYKAYLTRIVEDSIDIIMCQNNYYRTELGVKFDYFITNEIVDILYGKEYSLPKRSLAKEMGLIIGQTGIEAAINKYYSSKEDKKYFIDDYEFNRLGKELYTDYNLTNDSYKIYELAIQEYPNSFILNYSFGKILNENKNQDAADYLRKCLELFNNNPDNKEYIEEYKQAQSLFRTAYSSGNGDKVKIVEVTYIANEGFLIKVGDKKVLIDALFGDKDYGFCDVPAESTMNQLLKNKNSFEDIDIITASHSHPDHFFAPYVTEHLMNNLKGKFISCRQSIEILKKQINFEKIKNNLVEITPDYFTHIDTTINGIDVRVYRLAHGPYYTDDPLTGEKINRHQNIENVGFLFNIDGVKIFHSGDSDENGLEEYDYFRLNAENIDIAFLGRGFIWESDCKGIGLVKNNINAKHIVLMHIQHDEYNEFYEVAGKLKNEIKNIKIFQNELETETYIFE